MKIHLPKPTKTTTESDLLIAGAFKSKPELKKTTAKTKPKESVFDACKTIKELDMQIAGYLIESASQEGFSADEGQIFATSSLGKSKAKTIALLGLGDHHKQSVDLFRRSGGEAYKLAQRKRAKKISYVIPEKTTVPLFDVVQAVVEGIRLASYTFNRYHTKDKKENFVKEIELHLPEDPTPEQKLALTRAQEIAESVCLARDLINEGPMELNPEAFARHAAEVCSISMTT